MEYINQFKILLPCNFTAGQYKDYKKKKLRKLMSWWKIRCYKHTANGFHHHHLRTNDVSNCDIKEIEIILYQG